MMEQIVDKCDMSKPVCKGVQDFGTPTEGVLYYARGATGRVCPVLFLCRACAGESNFESAKNFAVTDDDLY